MEDPLPYGNQPLAEPEERTVLEAERDRRPARIVGARTPLQFGFGNLDFRHFGLFHAQHGPRDPVFQQAGPPRARVDQDRDAEAGLGIEGQLGAEAVDAPAVGDLGEPVFLGEAESVAVVDRVAVHQPAAGGHRLIAGGAHRDARGQRPLPREEVQDARAQGSGRIGQRHAQRLVVDETARFPDFVALGAARDEGGVAEVVRPLQTERLEQPFLEESGVAHSREVLDEQPQQVVARVVVLVAVPGFELEGWSGEQLQHGLVAEVQAGLLPELRHLGVALDPGGVVEQALDGHREPVGVVPGQVIAQAGGEIQLAILHQEHGGGRRELLGDRADPIHRVRGGGHLVLEVGKAETAGEDDLAVALDAHRDPGGRMLPEGVPDQRVDLPGELPVRPPRVGRRILRGRFAGGQRRDGEQYGKAAKEVARHGFPHGDRIIGSSAGSPSEPSPAPGPAIRGAEWRVCGSGRSAP